MIGKYLFLIILGLIIVAISDITRKRSFHNLEVYHEIPVHKVFEGESFKISIVIENKKLLPLFFLTIEEKLHMNFKYSEIVKTSSDEDYIWNVSNFYVKWFEKKKRTYNVSIDSRGTYTMRKMKISIGDIFGFYKETKNVEEFEEIVVYPKILDFKKLNLNINSLSGDISVRRWIHKDPMYIKGIREYGVEDRMKDIHWKSSLKMNKLMVKEYDYTTDKEIVIILNAQTNNNYYSRLNEKDVNKLIKVSVSLVAQCLKEGIPTGFWTNAQLLSMNVNISNEISPSVRSLDLILEHCARMDYSLKYFFSDYIHSNMRKFNKNTTYVIIYTYLRKEDAIAIENLSYLGISLKLIDCSSKSQGVLVRTVETVRFKEEVL